MTTQHHTDKRQFGRAGAAMALAFLLMSASAAPTLTIDSVLQRYPWSNTVDIRYTVTGLDAGQKADMLFKARIDDGADVKAASERIPGNGSYTSQWIPASGLQTTNCTVGGVMAAAPLYEPGSYMIVDLATGAISYEDDDPSATAPKYNDDIAYKTTKMVLRKIPAASGVFLQQSTAKSFTFAHDYYIGIFPVTEDQYHMIRSSNAGTYADSYGSVTNGFPHIHPITEVTWKYLRSNDEGNFNSIPGTGGYASTHSFISMLNQMVTNHYDGAWANAKFDLPTEAAWEYAASAGTSGSQRHFFGDNCGDALDVLTNDYAWCNNDYDSYHPVGEKMPNPWGLYDVYGNVWEWCRDRYVTDSYSTDNNMPANGFVAASSGSGRADIRMLRGGCYNSGVGSSSSTYRHGIPCLSRHNTDSTGKVVFPNSVGFRLSWGVHE